MGDDGGDGDHDDAGDRDGARIFLAHSNKFFVGRNWISLTACSRRSDDRPSMCEGSERQQYLWIMYTVDVRLPTVDVRLPKIDYRGRCTIVRYRWSMFDG